MSIIKVTLPLLYPSMNKNGKDLADFWHRKMRIKSQNCAMLDLQNQKRIKRPWIFYTHQELRSTLFISEQLGRGQNEIKTNSFFLLKKTWKNTWMNIVSFKIS